MTLKEFKTYVENQPNGKVFSYGITEPFSWRGSYDEVAFNLIEDEQTKEEMLSRIDHAFTGVFYGYKGGEYTYQDHTEVHFEENYGRYTDGDYCGDLIAKIEGSQSFSDNESRLVYLILNK